MSKPTPHLNKLVQLLGLKFLVRAITGIDNIYSNICGHAPQGNLFIVNSTSLQSMVSLRDSKLEYQLFERLSFRWFMHNSLNQVICDFTIFYRFKVNFASHQFDDRILVPINEQLRSKGMVVKDGTLFEASIFSFCGR